MDCKYNEQECEQENRTETVCSVCITEQALRSVTKVLLSTPIFGGVMLDDIEQTANTVTKFAEEYGVELKLAKDVKEMIEGGKDGKYRLAAELAAKMGVIR